MTKRTTIFRGIIILVIIFLIILVMHYSGLLRGIENILQRGINTMSVPLNQNKTVSRTWLSQRFCAVSSQDGALQDRINTLTEENAQLSQQLREFDQVRDITGYTLKNPAGHILAHVVGTVNQPGTQAIILDKGLRDGVKEGFAVIANKGILMGKTTHVTDNASQLILLNDRRSIVATTLTNNAKATGIVEGEFGLGLVMKYIPSNELVEVSSVVVTSGFESGVPGGLVIGTVDQVYKNDADLFQTATILPPLRYDEISIVNIINMNP